MRRLRLVLVLPLRPRTAGEQERDAQHQTERGQARQDGGPDRFGPVRDGDGGAVRQVHDLPELDRVPDEERDDSDDASDDDAPPRDVIPQALEVEHPMGQPGVRATHFGDVGVVVVETTLGSRQPGGVAGDLRAEVVDLVLEVGVGRRQLPEQVGQAGVEPFHLVGQGFLDHGIQGGRRHRSLSRLQPLDGGLDVAELRLELGHLPVGVRYPPLVTGVLLEPLGGFEVVDELRAELVQLQLQSCHRRTLVLGHFFSLLVGGTIPSSVLNGHYAQLPTFGAAVNTFS